MADYYSYKKLVIFGCAESGKTSLMKAIDGCKVEKEYEPSPLGILYLLIH